MAKSRKVEVLSARVHRLAQGDDVLPGITLREELANLQRMFPHKSGNRLRAARESVRRNASAATLWCYLRSSDNTYALHESVFGKVSHSVQWWAQFFSTRVFRGTGLGTGHPAERMGILNGSIIPGINIKSGKQWDLVSVIGYNLHDLQQRLYTEIHTRRHQA